MRKSLKGLFITLVVFLIFYFSIGFFVIQPIGAIPDGATVVYFRFGLNTSFVSSADGFLIDNGQNISLLTRALVLGTMAEAIKDRKIVTLPYSNTMYLLSTGGVEFEK